MAKKYRLDFAQNIWKERPEMSMEPVFSLEDEYTGEKIGSKLERSQRSDERKWMQCTCFIES
mgnify:CR=1 FL=1